MDSDKVEDSQEKLIEAISTWAMRFGTTSLASAEGIDLMAGTLGVIDAAKRASSQLTWLTLSSFVSDMASEEQNNAR